MIPRTERLLIALMFALLAAGLSLIFASAQGENPPNPPAANNITYDNCVACHKNVQETWQDGAHGHATSDSIFSEAWTAQGKPGACLVCHSTGYDPATGKSQSEGVNCGVPQPDPRKSSCR